MTSKRKRLNLKEKSDVLEVTEKEKLSVRSLAERFRVGETRISELLKDKEGIRKITTEKSKKELVDLVANSGSNVSVEEYVKIDDDLSIEEEKLHVSNFIHWDTTEALALSEDNDEESPMEDCKIKDYSEALKYIEN
ncbi:hypothetical protein AVEN_270512-1 [Araneus ventricosus]|uniref:HTH psq-type domain-containing protein n=1 Tax=Araneus ventricosus TaxID=182803 RepID=A0A4Y2B7C3_ARAVE|nr:hypothetical protein AVEN_270512-1 [Araneus ventricosus]